MTLLSELLMNLKFLPLLATLCVLTPARAQTAPAPIPTPVPIPDPPQIRREMRGIWIATVGNIDWPSKTGLPVATQKAEMIDMLDRAQKLGINAVFFQVRPATDALYESKIEPWSEFLSGVMGEAPSPYYDPLAFTIEEAHKRGLELHAWFNPYRARYAGPKTPLSKNHIGVTRPDLVKTYGKLLWMDPGEPEVQDLTTKVILDVVRRYDVDGIHFDDYFYPYQEIDAQKNVVPFPDDASFARYQTGGGKLSRNDWRRENVNSLVSRLHREIPKIKPHVRFGISPFGIWRPGYPAQIKGYDSYDRLYADSKLWLEQGWIDYVLPQLYWKIDAPGQSFPVLLNWWIAQNPKNRHVWAGQYTARATADEKSAYPDEEIEYQIRTARGIAGASGTVHFSAKSVLQSDPVLTNRLKNGVYAEPALVPATTWLSAPAAFRAGELKISAPGGKTFSARGGTAQVWQWIVQTRVGTEWTSTLLPGAQTDFNVQAGAVIEEIAVSSVDRLGNQSAPVRFKVQ